MARNRTEKAYEWVRLQILKGELRPSQRLIESQLAEDLDISRHSVREALKLLENDGLVEIRANHGATVADVTLKDVGDILLAREVLEGVAARLASHKATKHHLRSLREAVVEMEEALAGGRFEQYAEANERFHTIIHGLADNTTIKNLIAVLRTRVARLHVRTILVPGRSQKTIEEHRAILGALEKNLPEEAEWAMREHIASVRQVIEGSWDLVRM